MALTTLDVVNDMLGLLGERRVNAIDEPHPMIPNALAKLETATAWVQADMWWFNVEYPTLTPQAGTGELLVPNDTAACDSLTQYPRLAVRGNRLYNLDDVTDVFTAPIRGRLPKVVSSSKPSVEGLRNTAISPGHGTACAAAKGRCAGWSSVICGRSSITTSGVPKTTGLARLAGRGSPGGRS